MPRLSEAEREALRLAALAAVPVLAKLKEERAALDEKIANFETIIAAYEDSLGKRMRKPDGEEGEEQKPKRGQITEHINAVLVSGGDYREPEIRRQIWERFGIKYSRGTVYTALKRSEGKKYEQKEKRWRLKTE